MLMKKQFPTKKFKRNGVYLTSRCGNVSKAGKAPKKRQMTIFFLNTKFLTYYYYHNTPSKFFIC